METADFKQRRDLLDDVNDYIESLNKWKLKQGKIELERKREQDLLNDQYDRELDAIMMKKYEADDEVFLKYKTNYN